VHQRCVYNPFTITMGALASYHARLWSAKKSISSSETLKSHGWV